MINQVEWRERYLERKSYDLEGCVSARTRVAKQSPHKAATIFSVTCVLKRRAKIPLVHIIRLM
jgi:hypothetical protein